jgi:hypothetical protein
MKKLIFLFLTVLIVGCSSDEESVSEQTFFEKYSGVVWQEDTTNSYLFRFQNILNENVLTVNTYFVEEEEVNCQSATRLISEFFNVSENSASLNELGGTTTITATNNGNNLTIVYSDDPEYPEYYFRTNLNDPCD